MRVEIAAWEEAICGVSISLKSIGSLCCGVYAVTEIIQSSIVAWQRSCCSSVFSSTMTITKMTLNFY